MAKSPNIIPSSAMWEMPPTPDAGAFEAQDIEVILDDEPSADETPKADPDGTVVIPTDDGGVVVNFGGGPASEAAAVTHETNLAEKIAPLTLSALADRICEGIAADRQSMDSWLETRSQGLKILGIKLNAPRSSPATEGEAVVDGISTYDDPLLLQSITTGQAKAIGEFLPANGPVKITNSDGPADKDDIAEHLEKDTNYYLTTTAREYYPDTRRLLWATYFGGTVFRKVYYCPIRRRPVAEMVPIDSMIVSNYAVDIMGADRVTQVVTMRQSDLRRMVALGVYRDITAIAVPPPKANDETQVEQTKQDIEGVRPMANRPEDEPWTLYECYATVWVPEVGDIAPGLIPKELSDFKVPLQFKITIEKESRQVLEFVPNWDPDDPQCMPLQVFVKYSFVDWIGFYGLGMLHLVGNLTNGLTSMIREAIDTGQFANFAAFLYAKQLGQQDLNLIALGPGQGKALDLGSLDDIRKAAMPLPYKDVSPGFVALIDKLRDYATKMAGAADIPVGEGATQMPVGTVMAMIEQATTVESGVHKGLHTAFAEEFQILVRLFRSDPEALWRHDRRKRRTATPFWNPEKLVQALDDWDLVPKSDPNTPSHVHRLLRAVARLQVAQVAAGIAPGVVNNREVLTETFRVLGDDPQRFINPAPPPGAAPPPPDPKMIEAQAKLKEAQTKGMKVQTDAQIAQGKSADDAKNREDELTLGDMNLAKEIVIHQNDAARDAAELEHKRAADEHNRNMDVVGHHLDRQKAGAEHQLNQQKAAVDALKMSYDAATDAMRARTEAAVAVQPPENETGKK